MDKILQKYPTLRDDLEEFRDAYQDSLENWVDEIHGQSAIIERLSKLEAIIGLTEDISQERLYQDDSHAATEHTPESLHNAFLEVLSSGKTIDTHEQLTHAESAIRRFLRLLARKPVENPAKSSSISDIGRRTVADADELYTSIGDCLPFENLKEVLHNPTEKAAQSIWHVTAYNDLVSNSAIASRAERNDYLISVPVLGHDIETGCRNFRDIYEKITAGKQGEIREAAVLEHHSTLYALTQHLSRILNPIYMGDTSAEDSAEEEEDDAERSSPDGSGTDDITSGAEHELGPSVLSWLANLDQAAKPGAEPSVRDNSRRRK